MVLKFIANPTKAIKVKMNSPKRLNGIVTRKIDVTMFQRRLPIHASIQNIPEPKNCNCDGTMFHTNIGMKKIKYGMKKKKLSGNLKNVQNHGIQVKGQKFQKISTSGCVIFYQVFLINKNNKI